MGAINLDLTYHRTVAEFMEDDSFVRFMVGPIGSGKSTGVICGEVMRRALMQEPSPLDNVRYFKALIVRNTLPELKKTTIKTWNGMYPAKYGKWINSPPQHHIKIPGTKENPGLDLLVEFMGLDTASDAGKLLSYEGTLIAFNEVKEIPKEIVDAATGRVGRYPSMIQGGVMPSWYGIIADTNPFNAGHWIDKLEKDVPKGWSFYRQPMAVIEMEQVENGYRSKEHQFKDFTVTDEEYIHRGGGALWAVNPKAENLPYLPVNKSLEPSGDPLKSGGYYANLVNGKDYAWIQIYVQGKNGALNSDQAVIPEFDIKQMVRHECQYNPALPLKMGIDFGAGTLNPAAVFGQLDPIYGRWHILKEVVCSGMGLDQFADQILITLRENFPDVSNLEPWGDPAGMQRDGVTMKTYFDHLMTKGIYAQPAPSNAIEVRVESIRTPMLRFANGSPCFWISPECKILVAALNEKWYYKRLNVSGEVRYDEKPCKDHPASDIADALGYMMAGGGEYAALTNVGTGNVQPTMMDTNWDVI